MGLVSWVDSSSGSVLFISRRFGEITHNFAAIQGIECEINCLNFCTLWKGVCTDLFSILDYVCRSKFDNSKKHSDNAHTSSVDEIQGVSPLPSCRFYTLVHDHGVHDFFSKSFIQKQFIQLIKVKMKIFEDIFQFFFLVLSWGRILPMWFCLFPHFSGHNNWKRVTIDLLLGPICIHMHPYFFPYHHKFRLIEGCLNISNPLTT